MPLTLTCAHADVVANPFGPVHAYVNWPCGPHSSTGVPSVPEVGPVIEQGGGGVASTVFVHGPKVEPNWSVIWSM